MPDVSPDYEGLTEDELVELSESSKAREGEDHDTWAARARLEADLARKKAADRRAENEARAGLTPDTSSEAGTATDPETGAPIDPPATQ